MKKKGKKIISLQLIMAMVLLALAGCGKKDEPLPREVKRVVPTREPVDLLDEQGYEQVGDLTVYQNGIGENENGLYTMNVPSWNDVNAVENSDNPPVIAVIDSGIDYNHPEFEGKIIDMTQYSKLGGRYGYNCTDDGPEDDPIDNDGHGTHCAGIIASAWDGVGTSGVVPNAQLCIVKASVNGEFKENNTLRAFYYLIDAVDNGLNLYAVNCSFGGEGFTNAQVQAINELGKRGVIVCVASGNSGFDNDEVGNTASDYSTSPYALVVNSATFTYYPSDFSDYGQTTTDIFSPGDAIISTVDKNSTSYNAALDANRVTFDSFDDDQPKKERVKFKYFGKIDPNEQGMFYYETADEFMDAIDGYEEAGERVESIESFDDNDWSYEIDVPALSKEERAVYIVAIPIDEDDVADASLVSAATKSTLDRCQVWLRPITYSSTDEDASISLSLDSDAGWRRASNVWVNHYNSYYSTEEQIINEYPYYNGCIYYTILISDADGSETESKLYIDNVGTGYSSLRYEYFQGTSMATPMITGATTLVYEELLANGELKGLKPADRALYVANTMRARVQQYEKMDSTCRSNGAFDFNVKKEDYVPVINTVIQDETKLTLNGQFFESSKGKAVLNDKECNIVSWSDKKVVLELPEGTENGRYLLEVTAANDKKVNRKVVLTDLGGMDIFDARVEIPDEIKNANFQSITSIDGILYAVPETLNDDSHVAIVEKQLWSYNPEEDTWKRCADLPLKEAIKDDYKKERAVISNYNGYVIAAVTYMSKPEETIEVEGEKLSNCPEYTDTIYFYDPSRDVWITADIDDPLKDQGIVFGTDFGAFYTGGGDIVTEPDYVYPDTEDETETDVEPIEVEVNRTEESYTIYKLEFDEKALQTAEGSIEVKLVEAGTTEKGYYVHASASSVGNTVLLVDRCFEWLEWSEEDQQFTSLGMHSLPDEINHLGEIGEPVCMQTQYTGVILPEGTLGLALNGSNYFNRDYDSFYFDTEEKVTPSEKFVALNDLYETKATCSGGYIYVWGNSFYNGDGSVGYLTYTKVNE